jgi:isopenicillin-N N-acyltransferase-like protein
MLLDAHGSAADLETTPTRDARLDPVDGLLAHANHYAAAELRMEERAAEPYQANSRVRHGRMEEMLAEQRGKLDADLMVELLRDRSCYPDAICRMPGDAEGDTITFASLIASPTKGEMRIAVGPPNEHPYLCYAFGQEPQA